MLDLNPAARLGGFFGGGENALVEQAVFEGRLHGLAGDAGVDEIDDSMDEGVFVADDVTLGPPGAEVRVRAAGLGDEDVAETLAVGGVGGVEELQAVHVLEVEVEGALGAVDLDFDVVLAAEGEAGGFEVGDGAVLEAADEERGVVDGDPAHALAGLGAEALAFAAAVHEGTLLDERVEQAGDFLKFTDEITAEIDDVRIDVAVGAAAADALLQAPDERELRVGRPVLSVAGAVMINPADGAFIDHLLGLGDGGDAAVIVADHVDDLGLFDRGDHLFGLLDGEGEGLFAQDMFAGAGRGDGDLGMGIVGRGDVHDIDVGGIDDVAPVGAGVLPAELGTGGFDGVGVASADGVHFHAGLEREEAGGLAPSIGVGLAHEAVTDHSDTESLRHMQRDKVGIEFSDGQFI
jgi:hypothetical protein